MNKESENYLRMSLEDLESSKILYSNKKYSQAIFLLQQSIEKTTKGITKTFKHGHKTLDIYKKMVDKTLKKEIEKIFESSKGKVDNEKTFLSFIKSIKLLLRKPSILNLKVGKITAPNFILQHILSPHASLTRYPKGKYNPLNIYTKDYFLVKYYNKIYDLQKECLKECFKFIN